MNEENLIGLKAVFAEAKRKKTLREKAIVRFAKIIFPLAWYLDMRRRKKNGIPGPRYYKGVWPY